MICRALGLSSFLKGRNPQLMEVACLGRRFCKSDDHLERWRPRLANLQEGLSSFWRLLKRWCHPGYRAQELPWMCVVGIMWRLRICSYFFLQFFPTFTHFWREDFQLDRSDWLKHVRMRMLKTRASSSFCKSKIWISWLLCCFTSGSIF